MFEFITPEVLSALIGAGVATVAVYFLFNFRLERRMDAVERRMSACEAKVGSGGGKMNIVSTILDVGKFLLQNRKELKEVITENKPM